MNDNQVLKLQAYVDGELSAFERDQVAALIARDENARQVVEELQLTKSLLSGNETEAALPESREFHWSKISREIERYEAKPAFVREAWTMRWWMRYFSPLVGATALVMVLAVNSGDPSISGSEEVGPASPEASSVVFRSQSEKMTVVWLQGDANNEFANPEFDPTMRDE